LIGVHGAAMPAVMLVWLLFQEDDERLRTAKHKAGQSAIQLH